MSENRSRPKNLEGLLKFCLEATKAEDVQQPREIRQLSDEVIILPLLHFKLMFYFSIF